MLSDKLKTLAGTIRSRVLSPLKHNLLYLYRSRVLKRPYTHVVGDSHTWSFWGVPPFWVHHIGGATAYNLNSDRSTTHSKRKLWRLVRLASLERDIFLLCFGEIDARIHIYSQHMRSGGARSYEQLIDATIVKYGEALEELRQHGVRFFVYGIPPASKQENIFGREHYAGPEERTVINRLFNSRLRSFCEEKGYPYIDVYSEAADESGFILPEYAKDEVHLNSRVVGFVQEQMREDGVGV